MSDSVETFQLSTKAAEIYEEKFVPALFGEWAEYLVEGAAIGPGQAVIDVACGTGVVARAVARRVGTSGRIVGLDLNEGMLEVARRIRPDIEWHQGDAADLPFPASSFDAALCQAAMMFFPDRVAALKEIARVARPDGTLAIQVWGSLDSQPAYRLFAEIAARHAGDEAMDLIGSYFNLGDLDLVAGLFADAGLEVTSTGTRVGTVRFGSIDEFVAAEIGSTPLLDRIGNEVYRRILDESRAALAWAVQDGRTALPIQGHIITARIRRPR